jgi:hypothetical protein
MTDKPTGKVINWEEYSIHPSMYAPERPEQPKRKRRERLPLVEELWVPIPLSWLARPGLFPASVRLLLVLFYRSRRGREPVELDTAIAEEAHVSVRHRSHYARQLERLGAIRVERRGQHQLTATVLWRV